MQERKITNTDNFFFQKHKKTRTVAKPELLGVHGHYRLFVNADSLACQALTPREVRADTSKHVPPRAYSHIDDACGCIKKTR